MRKYTVEYENPLEIYMKSREELLKSIRNVKSNGVTAIGKYPSWKGNTKVMVQFESSLEHDMIALLEFDQGVYRYVDQPVKIEYIDKEKVKRTYTPDFIAYFRFDWSCYKKLKPHLYEVKFSTDLIKKKEELAIKFQAAKKYARVNGFVFKVITEKQIRTPYLKNAKDLMRYMKFVPDPGLVANLIDSMEYLKQGTPSELLAFSAKDDERRILLIPVVWYLVAQRIIGCDLHIPLNMESKIWHKEKHTFDLKSPLYDRNQKGK